MKGAWPKLTCSVEALIVASHSLPGIGVEAPHEHAYLIRAGWTHEINPQQGCTKPMQEMESDLHQITDTLNGGNLNAILPFQPTAEIMACWIMARLPAFWQFVEIECYETYKVRITADAMRSEWTEKFL